MSLAPDPFSLQFGPMTPRGSVTSSTEGGPPPLPPRPNSLTPDTSRFSHPERSGFIHNSSNQPSHSSTDTSYKPSSPYNPRGQSTTPNAKPTGKPNNPFSWRSVLGQVAKTVLFGDARPSPFTPSYASRVTVNGVELDLMSLQKLVGPVCPGTYW